MNRALKTVLRDDPHIDWDEGVEFRLTFDGVILAETTKSGEVQRSRAEHKHNLRKAFHPQLKRLWENSPFLGVKRPPIMPGTMRLGQQSDDYSIERLSARFERFGYHFVPLATRDLELLCSIEVLFLRYGEPGSLINRTGDIDNRLKTIFDALSMPNDQKQVGPYLTPDSGENPFFCLLEDDSIITKATVESDTLLQAVSSRPDPNDARLVITVRLQPGRVNANNIAFA